MFPIDPWSRSCAARLPQGKRDAPNLDVLHVGCREKGLSKCRRET